MLSEEVGLGLSKEYKYNIVVVGDIHQKKQLNNISKYNEIEIIYSKYSKANQTIRFYLDSMLKVWNADVIYSCGVGNAFFLFCGSWIVFRTFVAGHLIYQDIYR